MESELDKRFRRDYGDLLKRHGFRSHARRWYVTTDETITVFDLQKSQFGDVFSSEIGVNFKRVSPAEFPTTSNSDILWTMQSLLSVGHGEYQQLYNLENSMDYEERIAELRKVVDAAVSLTQDFGTEEYFRTEKARPILSRSFLPLVTRPYLGSNSDVRPPRFANNAPPGD